MYTIIGDPHITHKSLDKAETLFDIIEDLGNDTIILGDVLDTKEIIRGKCLNYVFERLRSSALNFIILVGNHDWFNLECKEHSLEVLKSLPNVTIVDKPMSINLDSYSALFMPYFEDLEAFNKELKKAKAGGTDLLFMHQGITGFDYGNGYIADGNGHGEIDMDSTKGFKRVISGHFHKYAEEGNLTFLGTPFSHSFGETDQIKYIGLYDETKEELKTLETPFPRHITLYIDTGYVTGENESSLDAYMNEYGKENIFRVILQGTPETVKAFDKSKFPGIKIIEKPEENYNEKALLDETESNEKIFSTWAREIRDLDEDTIKLGLEILGEVK